VVIHLMRYENRLLLSRAHCSLFTCSAISRALSKKVRYVLCTPLMAKKAEQQRIQACRPNPIPRVSSRDRVWFVAVGDTRAERDAWAECVACADEFDESRGCGAQCSGRSHFVDGDLTTCCELAGVRLGKSVSFALGAGVAGVFLFPSIVFALISSILEAACVIVCCKAMKEPPPRSRISNPPVVVDLPVGCYGAYGQTVVAHAVAQPIVHSVPLAQPSVAATAQPQAVAMAAPAVEYAAPSLK